MPKRERIKAEKPTDNYFVSEKAHKFTSSGCTKLDCDLGGGYVLGRMVNIVGDKSTAKTALATEAIINFLLTYTNGRARYAESEAAYDQQYAEAMGLPVKQVEFSRPTTVEEFAHDLEEFLDESIAAKRPGIYVIDSLDALSDEAEMARDLEKGTYGTGKAKSLGTMFRKLVRKVESSQVLLIVVSQVRDNIGALFGEKHRRSGGHAMDFYATHIVWLSHLGQILKTVDKVKRAVGIEIKAKIKKNKVSFPFRETEFNFIFGFGVDDVAASVNWLAEVGRLGDSELLPAASKVKEFLREVDGLSSEEYRKLQQELVPVVRQAWREIETSFIPKRTKYGG